MGTLRYTLPSDAVLPTAVTVTVQAGSTDAGYGPEFLMNFAGDALYRPARSASNATISFQIAFGSPATLAGMLLWHNADAGRNLVVSANTSPSWSTPAYSTPVMSLAKRGDGRSVKLWTTLNQTYQYWLVTLPANGVLQPGLKLQAYTTIRSFAGLSSPSGQGLGASGNAGKTYQWGARRANAQFGYDHATDFAVHWHYDLTSGAESESGPLAISDADLASLKFAHQATGGRAPVLFVPDSAKSEAWFGRMALGPTQTTVTQGAFVSRLDPQFVAPNYNLVTLTVEDITAGLPEWS